MTQDASISATEWWKASEYEIVGGTHIAPVEGAEIDIYDPFRDHEKFWGGRKRLGGTPPYLELLEVDFQDRSSILRWCRKYGLLGVLPHRTITASFWPRWEEGQRPIGGGPGVVGHRSSAATCFPTQQQYRQLSGARTVTLEVMPRDDAEPGGLLSSDDVPQALAEGEDFSNRIQHPGVRLRQVHNGEQVRTSIAVGYAPFFPRREGVSEWTAWKFSGRPFYVGSDSTLSGREAADNLRVELDRASYPLPYSPEFLREYGEPIYLMRLYARELLATIRFWEEARDASSSDQLPAFVIHRQKAPASPLPQGFTAALESIHPGTSLDREGDGEKPTWKRRWSSPSLYASFNLMVLQDYPLGDRLLKRCEFCDQIFATDDDRQKYCSETHRSSAAQARWREGKRAESKDSSNSGVSDESDGS